MTTRSDLRTYLRTLDAETLADLLHDQAERDPELRRRLCARARTAHGGLAEVSDLLDDAVRSDSARSVRLSSVLDTLRRLLDSGTTADVTPLARRVVDTLLSAHGQSFGPPGAGDAGAAGAATATDEELGDAVRIYARACAAHPPSAPELAEWFTRVAFDRPGWPDIALADFAESLGDTGIARVRSAVDSVLSEADVDSDDGRVPTARRLRLEIAELAGDVDTVVRLLSEQLPRLDVSLRIVRVLRAAGRHAEAIAHAANALGKDPTTRRGSLIDALERARADQAAGQAGPADSDSTTGAGVVTGEAADDAEDPGSGSGRIQETQDDDTGSASAGYRSDGDSGSPRAGNRDAHPGEPAASGSGDLEAAQETVVALLRQERDEQAWKAASACAPEELIPLYRADVERLIEQRAAPSYARAAAQLRRLRTLHRRAARRDEFATYLTNLVRTHRRKTRLIEEIRKARIALPRATRPGS
ncbi:hypothetical protein [Saccharomonospora saliphila]|uniref:hypothetical protein n=1 Tax=Saccharomonospora saliphila TaxID=369829 RepID=UPI00036AEE0E|nr:hypothetical protein [Saccharomonospora saliphila]